MPAGGNAQADLEKRGHDLDGMVLDCIEDILGRIVDALRHSLQECQQRRRIEADGQQRAEVDQRRIAVRHQLHQVFHRYLELYACRMLLRRFLGALAVGGVRAEPSGFASHASKLLALRRSGLLLDGFQRCPDFLRQRTHKIVRRRSQPLTLRLVTVRGTVVCKLLEVGSNLRGRSL